MTDVYRIILDAERSTADTTRRLYQLQQQHDREMRELYEDKLQRFYREELGLPGEYVEKPK